MSKSSFRFRIGEIEAHLVRDGRFRLDGGAMFGVVPKPLWEKRAPADSRNRIELSLNCLLLRAGPLVALIDTGIGNKWDEKGLDIYGIDRNPGLEASLAEAGIAPDQVELVVNTHLHFDHAGGNTVRGSDGRPEIAFPRARYVVQRGNLFEEALSPNELRHASYREENFAPLLEAARFELVHGDRELAPGIRTVLTGGHQKWHQAVMVESRGERAIFLGDLVPTVAHLAPAFIMSYDHYPLETLERKKEILGRASDQGWLVVLEHEPGPAVGRVAREGRGFRFEPIAEEA